MTEEISELSRILHNHLIENRTNNTPTVEQVADLLGFSPVQIYKIIEGERPLKVEDFPRFYRFAGKPLDALIYLVRKCDPELAVVKITELETNGDVRDEIEEINVHLGRFCELNKKALADGSYNQKEVEMLRKKAIEIRNTSESILAELNKLSIKVI